MKDKDSTPRRRRRGLPQPTPQLVMSHELSAYIMALTRNRSELDAWLEEQRAANPALRRDPSPETLSPRPHHAPPLEPGIDAYAWLESGRWRVEIAADPPLTVVQGTAIDDEASERATTLLAMLGRRRRGLARLLDLVLNPGGVAVATPGAKPAPKLALARELGGASHVVRMVRAKSLRWQGGTCAFETLVEDGGWLTPQEAARFREEYDGS